MAPTPISSSALRAACCLPQKIAAERAAAKGAVKVSWDTAYAGAEPLARYEVYRREEKIASVPFQPQTSETPFSFTDESAPGGHPGGLFYRVRAVDASGRFADSLSVTPA